MGVPVFFVLVIKVIAGLGGALIGWFLTGPLVRILGRVAFRKPVPNGVVGLCQLMGAIGLGLLLYYVANLGGGPGWGTGTGGGSGGNGDAKGGGTISSKKDPDKKDPDKKGGKDGPGTKDPKKILPIELLGGKKYKGDNRYYLIERKEPAVNLAQVDDFLQKNAGKYKELKIVLTPDSVFEEHPAVTNLRNQAAQKHKLVPYIEQAP